MLDPDALTIGFARRVPTYKRLTLILRERERLAAPDRPDRPVQLVFAGKAHPHDGEGKRLIEEFGAFAAPATCATACHAPRLRHGARARRSWPASTSG